MDYRPLGTTGLHVSVLGFGCGNVGGLMVRGTPALRERAVARALELGINYFDTAPLYGAGQSEVHLGQALRTLRAQAYVGTKCRLSLAEVGDLRGAIARSLEASLQRLGREQVELFQLHNRVGLARSADADTLSVEEVLEDVLAAFQRLQQQGKVRFYGFTGLGDTAALRRVVEAGTFHTVQVCYNLLNPSAAHAVPPGFPAQDFDGLLRHAQARQMGAIGIRVLAAGALSGSASRHPLAAPHVEPLGTGPDYATDVQRAQQLRVLVQEGVVQDLTEAALRFALDAPAMATVLVGVSSLDHLEAAAAAVAKGPLPEAAWPHLQALWQQWASRA
ncbi:MAG: dTDP-4-keto-L-6-deoxy-hexose 2,3-reductase [Candidatus Tectimicrobiota bacterium]|nr:MAG: dTDP-4-keto-L-6-deoxy-hexose 2,3-reductase [Candidatus Tectomicrobia bacterium]